MSFLASGAAGAEPALNAASARHAAVIARVLFISNFPPCLSCPEFYGAACEGSAGRARNCDYKEIPFDYKEKRP